MFSENICEFPEQQSFAENFCPNEEVFYSDLDNNQKDTDPYEINVFTRQVAVPVINTIVYSGASKFSAQGQYQLIYAHRLLNPDEPMFQNGISAIYNSDTIVGKTFQKIHLPKELQNKETYSDLEIRDLRQNGAKLQTYSGYALLGVQTMRLGLNVYALTKKDFGEMIKESPVETSIIISDLMATTSNLTDSALYNIGLAKVSEVDEFCASKFFTYSHKVNIVSNTIQIVTGGLRVYSEIKRYSETDTMNQSTVMYGLIDVGSGASSITYSAYLLKQSSRISQVSLQNNALMGVTKISAGVQTSLRIFGVAGAGIGFGLNAYAFYDSYNNPELSKFQKNKQRTSSVLGAVGSGLMILSALAVTSLSAPVIAGIFVVGMGFLVAQSVYDYWF